MPELPDVTVYAERLTELLGGKRLEGLRLKSPFLVRTADPPLTDLVGRQLLGAGRLGKRLVLGFEDSLWLVLHLMIAGRLRLREPGAALPGRVGLVAFDFENSSLILTEQGSKRRASLHLFRSRAAAHALHRGGLEPLGTSLEDFAAALARENHTLKRALTDQRIFSGIGNAYSDEILFAAGLSPVKRSQSLSPGEIERLYAATRHTLLTFTERLRREVGSGFPETVTAFRPDMAVHGKYGKPCPSCGTKVQRIRYADNETNYCPRCQTGGRLLADRSLSRLLKGDFPKTIDELEGNE